MEDAMLATGLRRSLAVLALAGLCVSAAHAHHGWSWAEGEQTTLEGTIAALSFAPPHPTLEVMADGRLWRIDLGNPRQTERSGFREDSAEVGDRVIVLGNRHKDASQLVMKAVRITIGGRNYDMYPERIKAGN
jgi:hypothetical protein